MGWVSTPVSAALICFVMLFIVQNDFEQRIFIRTGCPEMMCKSMNLILHINTQIKTKDT
jgi:hypothetical protein